MTKWDAFWERRTRRERLLNRLGIIFNRAFARHIARYIAKNCSGGPVLEIGTGRGICSRTLSDMGYECVAVDNSEVALKLARKEKLNAVFADGRNLPFASKSFEVAFSQGLLEHLSAKDQLAVLSEMRRVARVVINSVPMKYGVMDIGERIFRCFGQKWPYPDEKKYKKSEFVALLKNCFETVKVERFWCVDWIAYCR
jgi:ubiquinone/menaquinone biosynthesis C-methylase UbiE